MSHVVDPSMEDLPEPVMVDILSRLPVKKIVHCKCVCKKWLNIVLEPYFADLQLSRSPACFVINERINYKTTGILKWVEVEDELGHHNLQHDPVMKLDLDLTPIFQKSDIYPVGSVEGLVCLWQWQLGQVKDSTCICNPITREYMILPRPQCSREVSAKISHGFGVGSLTREYKVIRIFQKLTEPDFSSTSEQCLTVSEAKVYTLGTGQWRSLGHVPYLILDQKGTFLKGHAHWNFGYMNLPKSLCAFNFDKETFEFFPSPPNEEGLEERFTTRLGVLKGCLCQCDSYDSKFTVCVMKEYGVKNSWHKELVITRSISLDLDIDMMGLDPECVIEGFKDGTILMKSFGNKLFVYCPRRKTFVDTEISVGLLTGLAYCPSFHKLRNFENERVLVF